VPVFTVKPGERSPFGFKYRLFVGEVAYDVENGGAQRDDLGPELGLDCTENLHALSIFSD